MSKSLNNNQFNPLGRVIHMKRVIITLSFTSTLLLAFSVQAAQQKKDKKNPIPNPRKKTTLKFAVDVYQSPYSSSDWIQSTRTLLNSLDSQTITTQNKAPVIFKRWANAILNNLGNDFLMAVNHEVYGHGYLLRSMKKPLNRYRFFSRPQHILSTMFILPLGGIGAYTKPKDNIIFTHDEELIFSMAGSRANKILGNEILLSHFKRGSLNHHHANLYLRSFLDLPFYILNSNKWQSNNDISLYLAALNVKYKKQYGRKFKEDAISLKQLKVGALTYLLNPMVYKCFGSFYRYIATGEEEVWIPHFRIGKVKYLPVVRMGLAPFGTLYYLDNYFQVGNRTIVLGLRGGKSPYYDKPYGGIVFKSQGIISIDRYQFDPFINLYYQPKIYLTLSDYKSIRKQNLLNFETGFGYLVGLRSGVQFTEHFGINAAFGYKTKGFIEGKMPQQSFDARIGISLKY